MELKAKKSDLLVNLLRWTQGIAEKRGTMPILANLLLEASGSSLKVSATDLEISLAVEGKAEVKSPGRAVVNAKSIYEIIREAPEDTIRLAKRGDQGVEITSGKSQFRIVGMNAEEFPSFPQVNPSNDVALDAEDLGEMIEKTFYAASNDETRYTLNGVYLVQVSRGEEQFLRMVATDGHRLSYVDRPIKKNIKLSKGIIIPRKGIAEVKKLLSEGEGDLGIFIDEKAVLFKRGAVTLVVRLIEGDFPSYEQVIPKKTERIASLDRQAFMGGLRRASIMISDMGRGVRFSLSNGKLGVHCSNPDLGEVSEEIPADFKGSALEVGFNPKYFIDLLHVMEDEKIVLELKDEVSPCVIRSEFDRGFLALIMPMRI